LHHAVLERLSRGATPIHRRDPRAKILALLVFLIALATAERGLPWLAAGLFLLLAAGFLWGRIPLAGALARAALVLPFILVFAVITWLAGDPAHGIELGVKCYLSALAVVFIVSTTPLPLLLRGFGQLGAPRFVLEVGQFLYRYLFVISEEAQHITQAAQSRGGSLRHWQSQGGRFRAAAGALAILFVRSYARAGGIHRAMLARGFQGSLPVLQTARFQGADALFLAGAWALILALRLGAEGWLR
jgi:cobalt/nickel transport system permease protein